MTTLIQGMLVLKSSPLKQYSNMTDRVRLVLASDDSYKVHLERREVNGAVSEGFLYEGRSIDSANWTYDYYSNFQGGV